MAPALALALYLLGVLALLLKDRYWHPRVSSGAWIPVTWILIVGSRPVSVWLSPESVISNSDALADGSTLDGLVFGTLIVAGFLILLARKFSWTAFFKANPWLLLYFAYFAISALWSDYPFVSFKRWVKDLGTLVMVLVVLSDRDPLMTTKAVLMRCSYVLIPMSVVLVKYFPDRARTYDQWTGMAYYTGVSGDKNLLGMTLTALGLSLIWVAASLTTGVPRRRTQFAVCVVLLSATWWLLLRANSATALLCSFTGAALLLLLRTRMIGRRVRMCIGLIVLAGAVAAATGVWSGIEGLLLDVVDRDPSLTGRQEIWDSVLRETVNPLIGAGFYSFWLGDRVQRLSAGYHYLLNEAHNGFLEVYLNGGLIAVTLLAAILLSTIRKGIAATISERDREFGSFRLAVVAVTIIYGLTEAIFSRLDILWFALLLVAAVYRASPVRSPSRREYEEPSGRRSHHVDFARPL